MTKEMSQILKKDQALKKNDFLIPNSRRSFH